MKCPGCAADMAVFTIHSIEIDRCPACGGIALDKGEFELILAIGITHAIERGAAPTTEHRMAAHCHECDIEMNARIGAGDIEYDRCDRCERLFFDRGELTSLRAFANG